MFVTDAEVKDFDQVDCSRTPAGIVFFPRHWGRDVTNSIPSILLGLGHMDSLGFLRRDSLGSRILSGFSGEAVVRRKQFLH